VILSALVGLLLIIINFFLASLASRQNRKPEYVLSEDPTTRTPFDDLRLSIAFETTCFGTESPKKTASGFKIPPQFGQSGTKKDP
jgi:hypothetical protein